MKITLNNTPLELHTGAKVKDAILKYYSQQGNKIPKQLPPVEDRYGNEVAVDGELTDGNILFIRTTKEKRFSFPKVILFVPAIALLFACSSGKKAISERQGEKQAIIFAVNDIHATIDNFPKLAFLVDSLQAIYPDMLLVAAGADIALVNPGGVRLDHLSKGPIAIMNVYQFDPFGNELVVTRLTGNEIHNLMVAAFPVDDRLPVYPSGIRTKLKAGSDGNLTEVTLLTETGSPIDMNKTYTVAMNNYMTQVYKYRHSDPGQSLFITTAEATIAYLKRIQKVRSYRGEKRIVAG